MADDVVALETSILTTIKKLLGITEDDTSFDLDIIVHINTVFGNLTKMGVGPINGFLINGYSEQWDSYIIPTTVELPQEPDSIEEPVVVDLIRLQQVKTYIYQKVKLMFDPPSNGNLLSALKESIAELEYTLYTEEGGY